MVFTSRDGHVVVGAGCQADHLPCRRHRCHHSNGLRHCLRQAAGESGHLPDVSSPVYASLFFFLSLSLVLSLSKRNHQLFMLSAVCTLYQSMLRYVM